MSSRRALDPLLATGQALWSNNAALYYDGLGSSYVRNQRICTNGANSYQSYGSVSCGTIFEPTYTGVTDKGWTQLDGFTVSLNRPALPGDSGAAYNTNKFVLGFHIGYSASVNRSLAIKVKYVTNQFAVKTWKFKLP